jgi:hypothetical protein
VWSSPTCPQREGQVPVGTSLLALWVSDLTGDLDDLCQGKSNTPDLRGLPASPVPHSCPAASVCSQVLSDNLLSQPTTGDVKPHCRMNTVWREISQRSRGEKAHRLE